MGMTRLERTLLHKMRKLARNHGWTVAIHGSLRRDIDLIAVPWVDEASHWLNLYNDWLRELPFTDQEGDRIKFVPGRAHHRRCVLMLYKNAKRDGNHPKGRWKPKAFDVSFMPRIP